MRVIKTKSLDKVFFILAITSIILALFNYLFLTEEPDLEPLAFQVLPKATEISQINNKPVVFAGQKNGEVIGYAVVAQAAGYQSDITMMTGVDLSGRIVDTVIVSEQETPSFFRRITDSERFFEQFKGKTIVEGFSVEKNVDAVSKATISSRAITNAINLGANYVGKNLLNLNMPPIPVKVSFGMKEVSIILLMALAIYATYKHKAKIRIFASLFAVFVLGLWYNSFVTYGAIGAIVSGSVPNPPENLSWYVLVGGAFVLILFTGKNLFCYWVCPFGAMQEILAKIGGSGYKPSLQIQKYAKYLPGFFAWLALLLALVTGKPTAAAYEPFGTFFSRVGSMIQWALVPVVMLTSLFVFRFWCKYFCPVGYVLQLCVRLRAKGVRLWRNKEDGKTVSL